MQIILVVTLLHSTVCSVHCKIYWSLLFCTILKAAFYVDILVVTLVYNTVGSVICIYLGSSVLCRYLSHYFAAQYCRQRTMQIPLFITLLHNIVYSVLMQICWSLLYRTILQTAYYVNILVITLLHNTVVCVKCRYLGRYFAPQYC